MEAEEVKTTILDYAFEEFKRKTSWELKSD